MYSLADEVDIADIMEEVITIKAKYYALGMALRLHPGTLDAIRSENPQDSQKALLDVLLMWLRQRYNTEKYGPPTWKMLIEAVGKESGGNNKALAKKIAKNRLTKGT